MYNFLIYKGKSNLAYLIKVIKTKQFLKTFKKYKFSKIFIFYK